MNSDSLKNVWFTETDDVARWALPGELSAGERVPTERLVLKWEQEAVSALIRSGEALSESPTGAGTVHTSHRSAPRPPERQSGWLILRSTPFRLKWNFRHLTTSDYHHCDLHLRVDVRLSQDSIRLEAFQRRTIWRRSRCTSREIAEMFTPGLTKLLIRTVAANTLGQISSSDQPRENVAAFLRTELDRQGLEMFGPVEWLCPSAPSAGAEAPTDLECLQLARRLLPSEGFKEDVDEVIARLQNEPQRPLDEVIRLFPATQRHETLTALLLGGQKTPPPTRCWLIDKNHLYRLNLQRKRPAVHRIRFHVSLGDLRSIRRFEDARHEWLLAGAEQGVHALVIKGHDQRRCYRLKRHLHGNFNAAMVSGGWLMASHSKAGVIAWRWTAEANDMNTPYTLPIPHMERARRVHGLTPAPGEKLALAVDQEVLLVSLPRPPDQLSPRSPLPIVRFRGSQTTITHFVIHGDTLWASNHGGQLLHWNLNDPEKPKSVSSRIAGKIGSLRLLVRGSVVFLCCTTDESRILIRSPLDEEFEYEFHTLRHPIRRCWTRGDCLVGLTRSARGLYLWHFSHPDHRPTFLDVHHHRRIHVRDVCLTDALAEKPD